MGFNRLPMDANCQTRKSHWPAWANVWQQKPVSTSPNDSNVPHVQELAKLLEHYFLVSPTIEPSTLEPWWFRLIICHLSFPNKNTLTLRLKHGQHRLHRLRPATRPAGGYAARGRKRLATPALGIYKAGIVVWKVFPNFTVRKLFFIFIFNSLKLSSGFSKVYGQL